MAYSTDLVYLDFFKNAATRMFDTSPVQNRLRAIGFAAGTAFIGIFRIISRIATLVIKTTKVIFYALVSLFTLGNFGNDKRLKDHCKLLTLNAAAIIAQFFQIKIHFLAITLGIFHPIAAYKAMQIGTTLLADITSHENAIWQHYEPPKRYTKIFEAISSKITEFFNRYPLIIKLAVKTLLTEFSCSLDSALTAPIGYMNRFHSFGANPKMLTDEQKQLPPILLLNGNFSHQGTFLPLLHALQLSNNQRPVYTINLPPHETRPSFIVSKIEEIKRQYGKADEDLFEIDMIGHSMGSNLIQNICYKSNEELDIQIRRVITIGFPFSSLMLAQIPKVAFDIIGKKDCIVKHQSLLPEEQQINIMTGHLGLLFHRKSLHAMTQLLA